MPPPTPSPYVTLISSDGFEFIVSRDAAYVAGTIRKMLDPTSNFAEAASGRCFFETIKCVFFPFAYPVVEAVEVMLCKGAKGNANWRGVQQCDNNGEGGGVFVLQPQDERSDRCAGYGDSAGAVFGVVDGGGFFAGLEALVFSKSGERRQCFAQCEEDHCCRVARNGKFLLGGG